LLQTVWLEINVKHSLVQIVRVVIGIAVLSFIACKTDVPAPEPPPDNRNQAEMTEEAAERRAGFRMGPHAAASIVAFLSATYPDWTIQASPLSLRRIIFTYSVRK
jgi:hypothetical protein